MVFSLLMNVLHSHELEEYLEPSKSSFFTAVASSVVPYKSRGLNTTLSVSQSISSTKQSYSKNESSLRSKPNLTDESTQLQDTSRPDINLRQVFTT